MNPGSIIFYCAINLYLRPPNKTKKCYKTFSFLSFQTFFQNSNSKTMEEDEDVLREFDLKKIDLTKEFLGI